METKENKGGFLQAVLDLFKNKNFILMMLISTVNTAGQVFVKTPTSLFGKESLGMTGMQLGMITGTYYLICTIFRPITGPLIDKFNKKKVLSLCLLIKVVSYIMFALCQGTAMFKAARYVDAVSFCLCTTCFLTVASSLIDKKAMGTGIAIYSAFPSIVNIFMPSLAMIVYNNMGAKTVFIIGACTIAAGIILVQFLDFSRTVANARPQGSKKFKLADVFYLPVVPACSLTFFLSLLLTVNDTYLLMMATERGIVGAEIFFSIQSAMKVIASFVGGIGGDTAGVKKILILSCIATAISSLCLGFTQGLPLIAVAGVLYCLGNKGSAPVITKACAVLAPPEKRGAAISTNYFIMDLAGVLAGYISGFLYNQMGYEGMYLVMTAFPVIGLVVILATWKGTFGAMEAKKQ